MITQEGPANVAPQSGSLTTVESSRIGEGRQVTGPPYLEVPVVVATHFTLFDELQVAPPVIKGVALRTGSDTLMVPSEPIYNPHHQVQLEADVPQISFTAGGSYQVAVTDISEVTRGDASGGSLKACVISQDDTGRTASEVASSNCNPDGSQQGLTKPADSKDNMSNNMKHTNRKPRAGVHRNVKVVIVLPGNPSVVKAYTDIAVKLCLEYDCPVHVVGHIGHCSRVTPMTGMCGLVDSIKHHHRRLTTIVQESNCGDDEVLVLGHSIGGYILLKVYELAGPDIKRKFKACGLLAPTVSKFREPALSLLQIAAFAPTRRALRYFLNRAPGVNKVVSLPQEVANEVLFPSFLEGILELLGSELSDLPGNVRYQLVNELAESKKIFVIYAKHDRYVHSKTQRQLRKAIEWNYRNPNELEPTGTQVCVLDFLNHAFCLHPKQNNGMIRLMDNWFEDGEFRAQPTHEIDRSFVLLGGDENTDKEIGSSLSASYSVNTSRSLSSKIAAHIPNARRSPKFDTKMSDISSDGSQQGCSSERSPSQIGKAILAGPQRLMRAMASSLKSISANCMKRPDDATPESPKSFDITSDGTLAPLSGRDGDEVPSNTQQMSTSKEEGGSPYREPSASTFSGGDPSLSQGPTHRSVASSKVHCATPKFAHSIDPVSPLSFPCIMPQTSVDTSAHQNLTPILKTNTTHPHSPIAPAPRDANVLPLTSWSPSMGFQADKHIHLKPTPSTPKDDAQTKPQFAPATQSTPPPAVTVTPPSSPGTGVSPPANKPTTGTDTAKEHQSGG
eukprot:GHVN01050959.1.p1 GENE.GHVN01050959.1~~GHVN01050959.1.p1  ORF type:complete len:788 (-),score=117.18 GHVN01050959.1:1532-3895(-)